MEILGRSSSGVGVLPSGLGFTVPVPSSTMVPVPLGSVMRALSGLLGSVEAESSTVKASAPS